jgi:5-methylcytosine-specific restriction enzyme A
MRHLTRLLNVQLRPGSPTAPGAFAFVGFDAADGALPDLMPSLPGTARLPRAFDDVVVERVVERRYDRERRQRALWRSWYKSAKWKRIRKAQLEREPLCVFHQRRGETVAATVCDHVKPHRGDRERFFAGPFQSLCKPCHDGDKQSIERRCHPVGLA